MSTLSPRCRQPSGQVKTSTAVHTRPRPGSRVASCWRKATAGQPTHSTRACAASHNPACNARRRPPTLLTSRCAVSTAPKVALMTPMLPTREASSAYALSPAHLGLRGGRAAGWVAGWVQSGSGCRKVGAGSGRTTTTAALLSASPAKQAAPAKLPMGVVAAGGRRRGLLCRESHPGRACPPALPDHPSGTRCNNLAGVWSRKPLQTVTWPAAASGQLASPPIQPSHPPSHQPVAATGRHVLGKREHRDALEKKRQGEAGCRSDSSVRKPLTLLTPLHCCHTCIVAAPAQGLQQLARRPPHSFLGQAADEGVDELGLGG